MHSVNACWRDDIVLLVTRNWHFLRDLWLFPSQLSKELPSLDHSYSGCPFPDWHPGSLGSVTAYLFELSKLK